MIIRFFYNSSKSLFAKILFGAIIFSFGLWGVGDIIKSYVSSRTAIQVGKYKISVDNLRSQYSRRKQNLRNKDGKPLMPADMKHINVKEIVLDSIIAQAVETETIRQSDIVVPKISLAQVIHSLPEFQTAGKFDERLYASMLQQSGISEAGLLTQIQESISRNQLFHPIIAGYRMPNFIREALATVYESKKTILLAKIDVNKTKSREHVDDESLRQYYHNNADIYKKPEVRNITIMKIDYTKFLDEIKISEKDVESYFNEHKDMFLSTEVRDFDRFEFNSQESANATLDTLIKGSKTNLQTSTQHLSYMKRSNFPKYIADVIFSLPVNRFSPVYSIGGKFYIYKVIKITPPKKKTKAEILLEARKALEAERLNSPEFYATIRNVKNRIEDSFATGTDIGKVAKDFKLETVDIQDYDKQKDSEKIKAIVPNEESRKEILDAINSLGEKQASTIIDAKESDMLSYVVWVNSITKELLPPFEVVKNQVTQDYVLDLKNKETVQALDELCNDSENSIKQLKKFDGVKSYKTCKSDLLLNADNEDLKKLLHDCPYTGIVSDILSTIPQNKCRYYRVDPSTYLLIGVEKIDQPKQPSSTMKFIIKQFLGRSMGSDIHQITQVEIKKRQKISINDKIVDEVTRTIDQSDSE